MALLFFTDTETTGLPNKALPRDHANQPHIVQVAAILYDDQRESIEAQFEGIVRPDGYTIDNNSEAVKTHGITHERAMDYGLPAPMVANMLLRMVDMADKFVAYNEGFDHFMLLRLFGLFDFPSERLGNMVRMCMMTKAKPVCKIPPTQKMLDAGFTDYKSPKLGEAYLHCFGTPLDGAHSAFIDVRATLRLYRHFMKNGA